MKIGKDLVAASAVPLVLAILADGESYGYAIIQRVRELSHGEIEWSDGMLYPVLHWLEKNNHVRAHWRVAESGRKRKYYRLTPHGRAQLAEERRQWQAVDATLRNVWQALVLAGPRSRLPLPRSTQLKGNSIGGWRKCGRLVGACLQAMELPLRQWIACKQAPAA